MESCIAPSGRASDDCDTTMCPAYGVANHGCITHIVATTQSAARWSCQGAMAQRSFQQLVLSLSGTKAANSLTSYRHKPRGLIFGFTSHLAECKFSSRLSPQCRTRASLCQLPASIKCIRASQCFIVQRRYLASML